MKYKILESANETSVCVGDEEIAVFYDRSGGTNGVDRAKRFVAREEYLDLIAEGLCEYESRVNDDE